MKATFENSVNVLVKAYFNDTLEHGNCHACAVGNMVADSCGFTYKDAPHNERVRLLWSHKDEYYEPDINKLSWLAVVKKDHNSIEGIAQIKSTGYSKHELNCIEIAFESAQWENGDKMFNGLMAVVDVLADIHGIDLKSKEEAKALFVKV